MFLAVEGLSLPVEVPSDRRAWSSPGTGSATGPALSGLPGAVQDLKRLRAEAGT